MVVCRVDEKVICEGEVGARLITCVDARCLFPLVPHDEDVHERSVCSALTRTVDSGQEMGKTDWRAERTLRAQDRRAGYRAAKNEMIECRLGVRWGRVLLARRRRQWPARETQMRTEGAERPGSEPTGQWLTRGVEPQIERKDVDEAGTGKVRRAARLGSWYLRPASVRTLEH